MVDMAHTAGLIAAGLLDNPVKYAHIVTSTTHKTLRGPRGGMILMGKDFENPWGLTTPKGADEDDVRKCSTRPYSPASRAARWNTSSPPRPWRSARRSSPRTRSIRRRCRRTPQAMAAAFVKRGYKIVSGGTDNHLMLVDLRTKFPELTGKLAEKVPRGSRHHHQQEHGAVRQPLAVPDLGSALRDAGHHDPRSEGGPDGLRSSS